MDEILNSDEFPIDHPVTDTQMSALGLVCTLNDASANRKAANQKMLETIYKYSPSLCQSDILGRTPLHHASRACNLTAINFILSKCQGTPMLAQIVNQKTIGDETPLMKAAE